MTDALSLIGVFVLGLMLGGGIVGGCIGLWLRTDAVVIETLVRFIVARPGMLDVLTIRVKQQERADAALERAFLDKIREGDPGPGGPNGDI